MKYACTSESDVNVSLKTNVNDIKTLIKFINLSLPDNSEAVVLDYNFYTIARIERELNDAIAQVKSQLASL